MESPKCEVRGCAARVDVRLVRATTHTGVEERHYCAAHATEVLDDIARDFAAQRRAMGSGTERCEVHVQMVVCDGRDGYACRVYLNEIGGPRRMTFRTGRFEAWMLAWELRREPEPSLGTHRAMASAFRALGGDLKSVSINDVTEGETYRAQLHISQGGSLLDVEMRPSDAVILAVVCDIPIHVEGLVWQKESR